MADVLHSFPPDCAVMRLRAPCGLDLRALHPRSKAYFVQYVNTDILYKFVLVRETPRMRILRQDNAGEASFRD
jgi:hypothetical protein